MRSVLFCFVLAIIAVLVAFPQATQVTLSGIITDSAGAVIPAANIQITGPGVSRNVLTGSDGTYSVPLASGSYTIRVEALAFTPVELTVDVTRTRHFEVTLYPAPLTDDIPVISSIGDAAAGRPQFLPESELAQGTLFTAYGNYKLAQTAVATTTPWPTSLGGLRAELRGTGASKPIQLFVTTPTQISGVIPSSTPLGVNNVVVFQGTKESKPFPIIVVDSRPTFFTVRQTGSGPVVATHLDYTVITPDNPAAPNEDIVLWGNNWGASPKDGEFAIRDFRSFWDRYQFFLGGKELPSSQIQFAGVAGTNYGQMNLNLGPNPPTGCKVPIQFGWGDRLGSRTRWSNPVTIPIRAAGPPAPCSDTNGFSGDQVRSLFGGNSFNIASASFTEASFVSRTGTTNRFQASYSLRGWNKTSFDAPPATGSCSYGWDPPGYVSPYTPPSIGFNGTATFLLPFTQISFTPTTQSQTYAFPNAFTEGPFTGTYTSNFTAGGTAFQALMQGSYARDAGRARESLISRVPFNGGFRLFYDSLKFELPRGSFGGDRLLLDLQISAQDDTRGRHAIRCIKNPALNGGWLDLDSLLAELPARPNRLDVAVRFFQVPQIQFPHATGPLQRTDVFLDSAAVYQDFDSVR
jgi:uncharacterized protein (TIGR03437 family)